MFCRILAVLAVSLGFVAGPARAQNVLVDEYLVLDTNYVEIDGRYTGSAGGGGGLMSALHVKKYLTPNNEESFEWENVSEEASWWFSDDRVYFADPDSTLQDDGLVVAYVYISVANGSTTVVATWNGLSASGTITVIGRTERGGGGGVPE